MQPPSSSLEVSPADLQDWLQSETPPLLIDCREEDEFHLCRIEPGRLWPLSNFIEASSAFREGDDSMAPVVVYCHHGVRSMNATQFLRQSGSQNVWSLAGGIDRWSIEIDPTVLRY